MLRPREIEDELRRAHALIFEKLPKRTKAVLALPEKERTKAIRERKKTLAAARRQSGNKGSNLSARFCVHKNDGDRKCSRSQGGEAMVKFLLFCILLVLCWPLALIALVLYPLVWLVLLPFRVVGIAVGGVLELVKASSSCLRECCGPSDGCKPPRHPLRQCISVGLWRRASAVTKHARIVLSREVIPCKVFAVCIHEETMNIAKFALFAFLAAALMAPHVSLAQTPSPEDAAQKNADQARAALDAMVKALGGQAWLNMKNQVQQDHLAAFFQGNPDLGTTEFFDYHQWPDHDRIEVTKHRDVVEFYSRPPGLGGHLPRQKAPGQGHSGRLLAPPRPLDRDER